MDTFGSGLVLACGCWLFKLVAFNSGLWCGFGLVVWCVLCGCFVCGLLYLKWLLVWFV